MKRMVLPLLASLFFFFPASLSAAGGESLFPSMGRLVTAFVVVIMLIYALVYLLRKITLRGSGKTAGCIKQIGSYPLGQRSRITVVEIAGRTFLLGVTPQQVSMIAEFDPEEIEEPVEPSRITSFMEHLQRFSRNSKGAKGLSTG